MIKLIRTWKLPVAMLVGILLYYIFEAIVPADDGRRLLYYSISHYLQPALIFTMLMLSFLKVSLRDLRPHRWHGVLLLTQGGLFVLSSLVALLTEGNGLIIMEGVMLCFVCPTATASAVIVQKLGGSLSGDITYLVLCNLMVSLLAPGFFSLVEPRTAVGFMTEFFMIMGKVFPLLLCPLLLAVILRHYTPGLRRWLLAIPDMAFYMWLVALALAITVTWKTLMETHIALDILAGLALVSLLCCLLQFWLGRIIGKRWPQESRHVSAITAGQAFGQKNTVFVIWLGLVFLNPVTSVVGGFYSIWHNVINSLQLARKAKASLLLLLLALPAVSQERYAVQCYDNSDASVNDMAVATATSRSGLNRKMHQLLGVTPSDFLKEARMKKACQLLNDSNSSIAEIAYACGYSDPKYFAKCFKASTGKSPKEYSQQPG